MNLQPKYNQAITDFQQSCQKYMVCFTMTCLGLKDVAGMFASKNPRPENTYTIGRGHPNEATKLYARVKVLDAIEWCKVDGEFLDKIAKSFITAMYSEWDELYRPQMAREFKIDVKEIKSDLMGDVRLIRNCIVHNKSVITDEYSALKELKWKLAPGHLLVTNEMFSELIDQINAMLVRYEPDPNKKPIV